MLQAIGLAPYRHLHVHGYWNVDERKVSKSLGNMISPLAMRERYGFEPFRYFLLREMSFGLDASFSEEALVERINADLANNLGNLVSRTLNMIEKRFDGGVPAGDDRAGRSSGGSMARAVAPPSASTRRVRRAAARSQRARRDLRAGRRRLNRYLDERAPWKAAQGEPGASEELAGTTLYNACEASARDRAAARALPARGRARDPDARSAWPAHRPRAPAERRVPGAAAPPARASRKGAALFPRLESRRSSAARCGSTATATSTADAFDADRAAVLARARAAGVEACVAIGAGYGIDAQRGAPSRSPSRTRASSRRSACTRTTRSSSTTPGARALRGWLGSAARGRRRRVRARLPLHALAARRCSARSSPSRSRWRAELDLPVSIHVRGDDESAYEELLDIWLRRGTRRVSRACSTATRAASTSRGARSTRGSDVSFSGILTFKTRRELREVAAALPLDRLLVETDAPLLAPGAAPRPAQRARLRRRASARRWRRARGMPARRGRRAPPRATRAALFRLPGAGSGDGP